MFLVIFVTQKCIIVCRRLTEEILASPVRSTTLHFRYPSEEAKRTLSTAMQGQHRLKVSLVSKEVPCLETLQR